MSPEEIVAGQLAAYNRRDLEEFLTYYVDEAPVFGFPSGVELTDRSGPAFRTRYEQLFNGSPNLHAELLSRAVHGSVVVDHERVSGFLGDEVRYALAFYQVGPKQIEKVWFAD